MKVCDVDLLAVDGAGDVCAASGDGRLARVVAGTLVPFATVRALSGSAGAVALTSLVRTDGGLAACNVLEGVVLLVSAAGDVRLLAGEPLSPLGGWTGGPWPRSPLGSPRLLADSGARLYVVGSGDRRPLDLRYIEDGRPAPLEAEWPGPAEPGAACGDGRGGLYLTAAGATAVYRLTGDGAVSLVAGAPASAGASDGDGAGARFARITALAATPDGGCAVVDGARLRRVGPDGRVSTWAGGPPGDVDGEGVVARFRSVVAIAVRPDGSAVVADRGNASLRSVDPDGLVTTIARDGGQERAPLSAVEAASLSRAFAEAVVAGDDATAAAIAGRFVEDHRAAGGGEVDRARLPVSVASARVGRELAVRWCLGGDARLARVGAFALWLVRASEGDAAPPSDASRLAAGLARAAAGGDAAAMESLCACLEVAFDELRMPRDRSLVAGAVAEEGAAESAAGLLSAAGDARTRDAAVRVLALARDARYTAALLAAAADTSAGGDAAAAALDALWGDVDGAPAVTPELAETLRFAGEAAARAVAPGSARVAERAAARLRGLIGRRTS